MSLLSWRSSRFNRRSEYNLPELRPGTPQAEKKISILSPEASRQRRREPKVRPEERR